MSWRDELAEHLEQCSVEAWDPAQWVEDLEQRDELEQEVQQRLRALPTPLTVQVSAPEYRLLERILGWCRVLAGGSPDLLLATERIFWLRGGDPLVYLRRLRANGKGLEADVLARYLETKRDVEPYKLDDVPESFLDDLAKLGPTPDRESFEAILTFIPGERRAAVLRFALQKLREFGVDGDILFVFAAREVHTVALELIDEGIVSPNAIVEYAKDSTVLARPLWWAFAGRAAAARGDRFTAVRLLKRAADVGVPPLITLLWVWERADPELRMMLRKSGLGVPDGEQSE